MKNITFPKIRLFVFAGAFLTSILATSGLGAHEPHRSDGPNPHTSHHAKGRLVKVDAKTDAAWLAKQMAAYPTDSCVVSEDKLGADMGKPQDYIYHDNGKPERLVRFCCKDCLKDFK